MKRVKRMTRCLAVAAAVCLCFLCACQNGQGTTTPDEFAKACMSDGLTVALDADSGEYSSLNGLESYSTAQHGSETIFVQFFTFSDEDAAAAAYASFVEDADPGTMGTIYQNKLRNYTVTAAQADSSYTKLILSGSQIVTATGPTMYKSELDRILLKLGYQ